MDFAAIDFETANNARTSACAVGIAMVRGGVIADTYSSLIRPPSLAFDKRFIAIHGITPEKVRNAPTFAQVWPEIERRCGDGLVAAHNAAFDVGVITSCAADFGLAGLPGRYVCTVRLARVLLPGLPNHRLGTLANVFGIQLDHHDAASDAVACAELAIRFSRLAGPAGIEGYCKGFEGCGHSSERTGNGYEPVSAEDLRIKALKDVEDMSLDDSPEFDGRFHGMRFVFTGDLAFLSRTEAKANVERQGGDASESISKSTDIVVVGGELYNEYKQTGKTTGKLAKAVQLIQSGAPIDIIGESEFMDMIR